MKEIDAPRANPVWVALMASLVMFVGVGCDEKPTFNAYEPAAGPGQLVDGNEAVPISDFATAEDSIPSVREVSEVPPGTDPIDCGPECRSHCAGMDLQNPVNRGVCSQLWGAGLASRPIVVHEACRRLFVDMIGRFPSKTEVASVCEGKPWGEVVETLMSTEEFVFVQQRRWADRFLYNNQTVSLERIFDIDEVVGRVYRGEIAYDEFAAIASAHPVLTRRFDTATDRAEALFWQFIGRPPLGSERSDMARMFAQWTNGYYDHEGLGMRMPDAFIRFACINHETGEIDDGTKGACTSILWGYNEVILKPDVRAAIEDGNYTLWSGLLEPEEWALLQTPGRILAKQPEFWEKAVDDVIETYFGYRLALHAPEVRDELVRHLLEHNGDIRSVHYAIATSIPYLQSSAGVSSTARPQSFGPLKQIDVEPWLDSVGHATGQTFAGCDHRIPRPGDLLDNGSIGAISLLQASRWELNEFGELDSSYMQRARSLGGCPSNESGTRFKTISILTTATQLTFVAGICNPVFDADIEGVPASELLPEGFTVKRVVDEQTAESILEHQMARFYGRSPTAEELEEVRAAGAVCAGDRCNAEQFARPVCFALLSSSEMLFY